MRSRDMSEAINEVAACNVSALAAMLHFRRTGKRFKPRRAVVNLYTVLSLRPRPELRVVGQMNSAAG